MILCYGIMILLVSRHIYYIYYRQIYFKISDFFISVVCRMKLYWAHVVSVWFKCFVFHDSLLHSFVLPFALIGHSLVHCYRQCLTINHVSQCMTVHECIDIYVYIYIYLYIYIYIYIFHTLIYIILILLLRNLRTLCLMSHFLLVLLRFLLDLMTTLQSGFPA